MDQRFVSRLIAAGSARLSRRHLIEGAGSVIAAGGASALLVSLMRDGSPVQAQAGASTTGGLAEAINAYRLAHGKPAIPVSPELTLVAKDHVHDLMQFSTQSPYTDPGCLPHSWSTHGSWTGGCYNPSEQSTWPIMWNKPKEIAHYPGNGYENLAESTGTMTAAEAVQLWSQDPPHNDVMLNQGIWAGLTWRAVGGWVEDGWASVWFGEQTDPTPVSLNASPVASPVASPAATATQPAAPAPPQATTAATQPPAPAQSTVVTEPPPVETAPPESTAFPVETEPPMSTEEPPESTAPPEGTSDTA